MLPKPHCSLNTRCVANQPFQAFSSRFFVKTLRKLCWTSETDCRLERWFQKGTCKQGDQRSRIEVQKGRMIGMLFFKMEFYIQKTRLPKLLPSEEVVDDSSCTRSDFPL